jgi:hypothetical protein
MFTGRSHESSGSEGQRCRGQDHAERPHDDPPGQAFHVAMELAPESLGYQPGLTSALVGRGMDWSA